VFGSIQWTRVIHLLCMSRCTHVIKRDAIVILMYNIRVNFENVSLRGFTLLLPVLTKQETNQCWEHVCLCKLRQKTGVLFRRWLCVSMFRHWRGRGRQLGWDNSPAAYTCSCLIKTSDYPSNCWLCWHDAKTGSISGWDQSSVFTCERLQYMTIILWTLSLHCISLGGIRSLVLYLWMSSLYSGRYRYKIKVQHRPTYVSQ